MLETMNQVCLNPATVIEVSEDGVEVALPAGAARAELALGYPYEPKRGDRVLVIGDDRHYVIGVLNGRGITRLSVPGDLELNAGGSVKIKGGRGIALQTEQFTLRASRAELIVQNLFERFGNVYRWVQGVMQASAARVRMLVSGSHVVHAERIVERAQKDVRIDGERINLG